MAASVFERTVQAKDDLSWIDQYRMQRSWLRKKSYLVFKRIFDLTACILALPLLVPVFALVALLNQA